MVLLGFPNAQPNLLDRVIPIIGRGGFTDICSHKRESAENPPHRHPIPV